MDKLRNEDVKNQFQLTLANKYNVLYNGLDMEEEEEDSIDKRMEKHQKYVPVNLRKPETGRKLWMSDHTWKLVE